MIAYCANNPINAEDSSGNRYTYNCMLTDGGSGPRVTAADQDAKGFYKSTASKHIREGKRLTTPKEVSISSNKTIEVKSTEQIVRENLGLTSIKDFAVSNAESKCVDIALGETKLMTLMSITGIIVDCEKRPPLDPGTYDVYTVCVAGYYESDCGQYRETIVQTYYYQSGNLITYTCSDPVYTPVDYSKHYIGF